MNVITLDVARVKPIIHRSVDDFVRRFRKENPDQKIEIKYDPWFLRSRAYFSIFVRLINNSKFSTINESIVEIFISEDYNEILFCEESLKFQSQIDDLAKELENKIGLPVKRDVQQVALRAELNEKIAQNQPSELDDAKEEIGQLQKKNETLALQIEELQKQIHSLTEDNKQLLEKMKSLQGLQDEVDRVIAGLSAPIQRSSHP